MPGSPKKLIPLFFTSGILTALGIGILWYQIPAFRELSFNNLFTWLGAFCVLASGTCLGIYLSKKFDQPTPSSIFATSRISEAPPTDDKAQFLAWQNTVIAELDNHAKRLEEKSQLLVTRMVAFQEWTEFPKPLDLNLPETRKHLASEKALRDKDHQVSKIIEDASQVHFEKLKNNYYSINGKFNWPLLRDDSYELARQVARVYRPDVEHPLLETSTELLLRAVGRMSFHFLVVLEQLPLDVKSYNISTLYDTVRKSVQAYGYYKKASPYLGYLSRGVTIGRMVTAANPVVAGIWWGASELGKIGAEQALKHVVNQQIVSFIQDLVRVVGYEIAAIYGGDFRYRDANWICAVELTDLLASFPLSRESLAYGLQEIGRFPLRNEYDRIYLYRCLANHQSSGWKRPVTEILSHEERTQIAEQLEKSWRTVLHGKTTDRTEKWRKEAELRLGVKLKLETQGQGNLPSQARITSCLDSLIYWLLNHKPLDYADLKHILQPTRIAQHLSENELHLRLSTIHDQELTLPDYPDLDPNDPLLEEYLQDVITLMVKLPVYHLQLETELKTLGAYYRKTAAQMDKLIEAQMRQLLTDLQPADLQPQLQRLAADHLRAAFISGAIYQPWQLLFPAPQPLSAHQDIKPAALILIGDDTKLYILEAAAQPRLIWTSQTKVTLNKIAGYLSDSCELTGGNWETSLQQLDNATSPKWIIPGVMTEKFDKFFAPLLQWNQIGIS